MSHVEPAFAPLLRDPHPLYAELSEREPVCFHAGLDAWLVSRHADVAALLRDPRLASARPDAPPVRDPLDQLRRRTFLFRDPPRHDALRALCHPLFHPQALARLRPRIEAITRELLEPMGRAGRSELIAELATALPVRVISEVMGLPAGELANLRRWSDALALVLAELEKPESARAAAGQSLVSLQALLEETFAARRAAPRRDLVSALVAAEQRGELDAEELLATAVLIFLAGHETTSNLIGNGIAALASHPGERARLARQPEHIGRAVEEFLRFESPVQATRRFVLEDLEIGGRRLARGERVVALIGAANRDPRVFDEPERLRIDRDPNRHLAFGAGLHFCLGAALARIEAQIAIGAFLRRFPDFALAPEGPRWKTSSNLRGLATLPLVV